MPPGIGNPDAAAVDIASAAAHALASAFCDRSGQSKGNPT